MVADHSSGRVFLVGCFLFMVCACTGPSDQPVQPHDRTRIVFKHGKLSGDPAILAGLLRDFEQRTPGVSVIEEILPSSSDLQRQFYAVNLEGRSVAFDLFAADIIWVQEFARAGWIRDLDEALTAGERSDYFPEAIRAATFRGHLFAVPWRLDAGVLYYRRDLLERYGLTPPRTWSDLVRSVRLILAAEHDPALRGFIWQGKQYEGLMCVALEFIWGLGGELVGERGLEAEDALTFMRALIEEGISPALVSTADEESTRHLFGAGRAVFMRNWPYAWALFQQKGSPLEGRVGLAPLPSHSGHESVSVLGGWMLAVPSRSPHPREAEALLRFLTSPDAERRMARDLGYQPARHDLYQDAALLRDQPWLADLYPLLVKARPRPVTSYYPMWSQALQPQFSAVVVGMKSSKAALASARRQMGQIVGSEGEDVLAGAR